MIICYRYQLLYRDNKDFAADGLNSVKYQVLRIEFKQLYTRIYVSVNESEIKQVGSVRITRAVASFFLGRGGWGRRRGPDRFKILPGTGPRLFQ